MSSVAAGLHQFLCQMAQSRIDPVADRSSRGSCVGATRAQTDPQKWLILFIELSGVEPCHHGGRIDAMIWTGCLDGYEACKTNVSGPQADLNGKQAGQAVDLLQFMCCICWDIDTTQQVQRHNVRCAQCRITYCWLVSANRRSRNPTRVLHAPPWATTSAAGRPVTIAHYLFSRTVLTRPLEHGVITLFPILLVSIDATLTTIVGDRLLLYWYSTIAVGGVCVPTSERTGISLLPIDYGYITT